MQHTYSSKADIQNIQHTPGNIDITLSNIYCWAPGSVLNRTDVPFWGAQKMGSPRARPGHPWAGLQGLQGLACPFKELELLPWDSGKPVQGFQRGEGGCPHDSCVSEKILAASREMVGWGRGSGQGC